MTSTDFDFFESDMSFNHSVSNSTSSSDSSPNKSTENLFTTSQPEERSISPSVPVATAQQTLQINPFVVPDQYMRITSYIPTEFESILHNFVKYLQSTIFQNISEQIHYIVHLNNDFLTLKRNSQQTYTFKNIQSLLIIPYVMTYSQLYDTIMAHHQPDVHIRNVHYRVSDTGIITQAYIVCANEDEAGMIYRSKIKYQYIPSNVYYFKRNNIMLYEEMEIHDNQQLNHIYKKLSSIEKLLQKKK